MKIIFSNFLQLLVLWELAVVQPVFDILKKYPDFLVAHHVDWWDILIFITVLTLAVPAILTLLESGRRPLHYLFLFILSGTLFLVIFKSFFIALILASVFIFTYFKFFKLGDFLSFLAISVLIFTALFIFSKNISKIIVGSLTNFSVPVAKPISNLPPIIFIVFDEFPTSSLLSEDGLINSERYPNLANLVKNSYWFKNASAVHPNTEMAVPEIISGTYANPNKLPYFTDYPQNIFSLLKPYYEIKASEHSTFLYKDGFYDTKSIDWQRFFYDVGLIYLHRALPNRWQEKLPKITDWKYFIAPSISKRLLQFEEFLSVISSDRPPTLYFLQIHLPHRPFQYLPSGKFYHLEYKNPLPGLNGLAIWNDDALATQALKRHLLQVGFVDKLIGDLIDRLKKENLYDPAMIILTADHGISFIKSQPDRAVTPENYQDIMKTPLIIKKPFQAEATISEIGVESVDILPSIADYLNIKIPWQVDGRSLFDSEFISNKKEGVQEILKTAKRINNLFGKNWNQLYQQGADLNLIGQLENGLKTVDNKKIKVEIFNKEIYDNVNLNNPSIPILLTGRLINKIDNNQKSFNLAVGLNGKIATTAKTFYEDGEIIFSAILNEQYFKSGKNVIKIFLMANDDYLEELGS